MIHNHWKIHILLRFNECIFNYNWVHWSIIPKKGATLRAFMKKYKVAGYNSKGMLDPKTFMRVQRSFIVNINAIKDVLVYSKARLRVMLHVDFDKEIIVSREKTKSFKDWLSG